MQTINVTIGIELEFAVYDETGTLRVLTHDLFPYTKDRPLREKGYVFHRDGPMMEIAFPPCEDQRELDDVVHEGICMAGEMLPEGWDMRAVCAAEYTDDELALDPYASEMGCSPSRNLYNSQRTPDEYPDNWRFGGMHVNVGCEDVQLGSNAVHALDVALAMPDTGLMSPEGRELVYRRRECYGRAGEYRQRPFGIEYRALPVCAWDRLGPTLFERVTKALNSPTPAVDVPSMVSIINGE